jgi:RNA polymerase sigma-70 factor (ECF subfamily)
MLYAAPASVIVPAMTTPASAAEITAKLLAHREIFKAFLASRLGNEADAEDLLQNGLVKAVERAGELKDGERAVAWFYQLLRNVLIDHVRRRRATAQRDDRWAADTTTLADDSEADRQICACFEKLLLTLKPAQAELLRRVELNGEAVSRAAAALDMTPNRASVTLHRARGELREKLAAFCGDCQCLDHCDCEETA